jgi:carbon-monoxide dehydrogenase medium subunit
VFAAEASRWLAGKAATDESFARAGALAASAASPISDMRGTAEFRMHLVSVLTRRTLSRAVARVRGVASG